MVQQQVGTKPQPNRFNEHFGMLPQQAQSLLQRLLAMDPSKRISAKDALDHDYFWEEPYPSKPEDLPKYAQSHEFTAKKRRQDQAKAAPARRRRSPPTNRYHTSDLRT